MILKLSLSPQTSPVGRSDSESEGMEKGESQSTGARSGDDFEKQLEMRLSALRTPPPSPIASPMNVPSQRPERARYPSLSLRTEEEVGAPVVESSARRYPEIDTVMRAKPAPTVTTVGERRLNANVQYDGFLMRDSVKYVAPKDLVQKFLIVAG